MAHEPQCPGYVPGPLFCEVRFLGFSLVGDTSFMGKLAWDLLLGCWLLVLLSHQLCMYNRQYVQYVVASFSRFWCRMRTWKLMGWLDGV